MTIDNMPIILSDTIRSLDRFLEDRNSLFPARNKENDGLVTELLSEFVKKIDDLARQTNYSDPSVKFDQNEPLIEKGIFLCGYMKSGTTLLLEMLDEHPELVVMPGDSWFMGRTRGDHDWSSMEFHRSQRNNWIKRMVNPTGQAPFWLFGRDVQPYVDFQTYYDHWSRSLDEPLRGHIISAVLAYFYANPNKPPTPQFWVEKTPGNEFDVKRILSFFPEARFIHIVRDPRENMASLKKLYETREWKWDPIGTADTLAKSCLAADANMKWLGRERYHVLSYEDLTEDPVKRITEITRFLGIQWNASLLRPTVNGMLAHANSMYEDRQVTGTVRKSTKDKWRTVLTRTEQQVALGTIEGAKKVGYEWNITKVDFVSLLLIRVWRMVKQTLVERG